MPFENAKAIFLDTIKKTMHMGSALSLMSWDMQTVMPLKGGSARAQALGTLSGELFRLSTSEAFGDSMQALNNHLDKLTANQKRMLEEAQLSYTRFKKIPQKEYEDYSIASAESEQAWRAAKNQNDFKAFAPHLQKMIDYTNRFADLWDEGISTYDMLLKSYDPAMLTKDIDPIFSQLLQGTRELLKNIPEMPSANQITVNPAQQKQLGEYLLSEIGYDMQAGNLFTTEHPFTATIHSGDIRVTTKYLPDDPTSSIFSVLHEGGHGIYEQNISPELDGTNLFNGASMGIHESQSRFYENIIGRSYGFWETRFEKSCQITGVPLAKDARSFWKEINKIQPSLIRIEADELTYNLHIIIRYEIEKEIFANKLKATDLPDLWNAKYKEYLGLMPESYTTGIMQDSHWSGGAFGYFPSYALGNLYAAQFASTITKEIGDIKALATSKEGIEQISNWLHSKIHQYGMAKKPAEILFDACGESLNPNYFLTYMKNKISSLQ